MSTTCWKIALFPHCQLSSTLLKHFQSDPQSIVLFLLRICPLYANDTCFSIGWLCAYTTFLLLLSFLLVNKSLASYWNGRTAKWMLKPFQIGTVEKCRSKRNSAFSLATANLFSCSKTALNPHEWQSDAGILNENLISATIITNLLWILARKLLVNSTLRQNCHRSVNSWFKWAIYRSSFSSIFIIFFK